MAVQNIEITYGIHRSPFGWCTIGLVKNDVCHLSFMKTQSSSEAVRHIREVWPYADLTRDNARTETFIRKIFSTSGKKMAPFHLLMKGTDFQIKVWEALMTIPKGETKSYAAVAKAIGSPKAVRAVGSACGANAIAYLIPCHRVLTSNGGIGGYHWGIARKKAMLTEEKTAR